MSRYSVGLALVLATPALLSAEPSKLALLVGCSEYDNRSIDPLPGSGNDVELWRQVLRTRFGFADAAIARLTPPAARPTHAAVVRAFDDLVRAAQKNRGSVVFILLSGHGAQVAEDPAAGGDPEPDGLDEVFLPADAGLDDTGGAVNVIRDNEIGVWLDRLRAAGAHVCVVFDCCHSGTMTRGDRPREVIRAVSLAALCRTPAQAAGFAARDKAARDKAAGRADSPKTMVRVGTKAAGGTVVAFYAAQAYEAGIELPRPRDAADRPENRHGLLTYTLIEALEAQPSPDLTYRGLERVLLAKYAAERGVRPPIPFCEGDRDACVLGTGRLAPPADFLLKRTVGGDLELDAGALRGLTPGAVLSVHPHPADRPADPKAVLGHVRVRAATPMTATAEPCDRAGRPADKAPWPKLTRCEVVTADLGSLQVVLHVRPADPLVRAAVEGLATDVRGLVRSAAGEAEAEWLLRRVTQAESWADYGRTIPRDAVLLVQGDGRTAAATDPKAGPAPPARRVFATYPADAAELARGLDRDLPKVYRWQNLWRVAAALPAGQSGAGLEVRRAGKPGWAALPAGADVHPGDAVRMTFTNATRDPVWVTHLALDSNLGIVVTDRAGAVGPNESWPMSVPVGPAAHGREGGLFLVVVKDDRPRPGLDFLQQGPLTVSDQTRGDPGSTPKSPFGQLLRQAAWGGSGTRGGRTPDPATDPVVFAETWTARPAKRPH